MSVPMLMACKSLFLMIASVLYVGISMLLKHVWACGRWLSSMWRDKGLMVKDQSVLLSGKRERPHAKRTNPPFCSSVNPSNTRQNRLACTDVPLFQTPVYFVRSFHSCMSNSGRPTTNSSNSLGVKMRSGDKGMILARPICIADIASSNSCNLKLSYKSQN